MKFKDPHTGREAIIDGRDIRDANGSAVSANTYHVLYTDAEGVVWEIEGDPSLVGKDEWTGRMRDMSASVYAKSPVPLLDTLAMVWKHSLLDVVEAIDAFGFAWRSNKRKAKPPEGDGFPWLVVLAIALLAKGRRR